MKFGLLAAFALAGCTVAGVETARERAPGKPVEAPEVEEGSKAGPLTPDASPGIVVTPPGAPEAGAPDAGARDAGWDGYMSPECSRDCQNATAQCGVVTSSTSSAKTCFCGVCTNGFECWNGSMVTAPVKPNKCVCPDDPNPCAAYNTANPGAPQVPTTHGYSLRCSFTEPRVESGQCSRIPDYYCCP